MILHRCLLLLTLLLVMLAACTQSPVDPRDPDSQDPESQEFDLKISRKMDGVLKLTWKPQPGSSTYQIYRFTQVDDSVDPDTAPYTLLGETKDTTFNDKTVSLANQYYYRIRARYTDGKSIQSYPLPYTMPKQPTMYQQAYEVYTKLGAATGGQRYDLTSASLLTTTITKIIKEQVGNQPADIVILLDNTGSMGDYIDDCRAGLNEIIDALPANARLGAAGYRDRHDLYIYRYQALTTDFTTIRRFLANMTSSGGGDVPEAVYDAVYGVVTEAKWVNPKRIMIVVGDAPPHDEPGTTDHHYQEVVDKCRQAGVNVNLYPILIDKSGEVVDND